MCRCIYESPRSCTPGALAKIHGGPDPELRHCSATGIGKQDVEDKRENL